MKRLLFLLMIVIITLVACSENSDEEEEQVERVTPVETGEVTKGDLVMERNFYGRTMPNQTTPVIPSVAGEIDELEVENGDKVEEDDDIAIISSPQGNITVEAPADGVISQLEAKEGSMVSNQDPLATIIDLEQLTVQLQVPDVQLELFEKGKEVTLLLQSAEEETHEAEIEYVADAANEAGLFPIDLSFDNETTHYKAGVIATVVLEDTVIEDSLLIPTAALVEENDDTYVYVVEDDTAKKVEIDVQATQSELTAIQAELNEGDQIITSGQLTLVDGSKISVVEED
ncbi:efflux RND transporter periplasmic adaptor subunit [Gracilibacillus thailandensis]|uniref:Efflux RND transporter periplasmic adaptor subunit n=1 Tax=Gracilibacillus thailandensis TaxID=563735 RepID=A0A6N7R3Y8_9BACI|nr:efflux RND transporter periplasmic adaptor subunit [Gracilibacillus thailandensis]MRI67931.1 efflux RND transporter periplasmic adaptor subunit [Gracilibacillus thailandensis]